MCCGRVACFTSGLSLESIWTRVQDRAERLANDSAGVGLTQNLLFRRRDEGSRGPSIGCNQKGQCSPVLFCGGCTGKVRLVITAVTAGATPPHHHCGPPWLLPPTPQTAAALVVHALHPITFHFFAMQRACHRNCHCAYLMSPSVHSLVLWPSSCRILLPMVCLHVSVCLCPTLYPFLLPPADMCLFERPTSCLSFLAAVSRAWAVVCHKASLARQYAVLATAGS